VNAAYLHIATRRDLDFPELHKTMTDDTADGTTTLQAGTDTLYIEEIFDDDNKQWLKWIPWSKYVSYTDRANTSAEGKPIEWHRRGTPGTTDIFVYPTPDDAYTCTISYRYKPALLTSTNTTVIGDEWDEPIVTLATVFGFRWLSEFDKSEKLFESWMQTVRGLAGIYDIEEKARRETARPSTLWSQGKDGYR
jgi:hypothetical protein